MSSDQKKFERVLEKLAVDLHKSNRIKSVFGIAGDPITPLIGFTESLGIRYYGFRNEQAASYAASVVSFLSRMREVGVCMCVAGPGMVNALAGLGNAVSNGWPMLLICPFTPDPYEFQYIDQLQSISGLSKGFVFYNGQTDSVYKAIDMACAPPYGPVVLFIEKGFSERVYHPITQPTRPPTVSSVPSITSIEGRVLLVIGPGAVLRPSMDAALRDLVSKKGVPFLAESMARGLLSESHAYCVSAARSNAFKSASAVILVGTKLDWMLAYGKTPKWSEGCKFFQFTDDPIVDSPVRISRFPLEAIRDLMDIRIDEDWRTNLIKIATMNRTSLAKKLSSFRQGKLPSHLEAIGAVKRAIIDAKLEDCLVVSEGANTMDVTKISLDNVSNPCRRLDAGRWGTMGSGLGYVVAACAQNPNYPVICIQGDSAFGFSGMELETLVRYKCKVVIVIFNNGGIYTGATDNATAFCKGIRHDMLMKAFGGEGLSTGNGDAQVVADTMRKAFKMMTGGRFPVLVDINIDPSSGTQSGSLSRL
jgi:oxalyl-CoA decarboxylase